MDGVPVPLYLDLEAEKIKEIGQWENKRVSWENKRIRCVCGGTI